MKTSTPTSAGTSYSDNSVASGVTYTYQVTAKIGGEESGPSNTVTVTAR